MFIFADNPLLQYSGRIDFENKKKPVFVYPASFVRFRFTGKLLKIQVENKNMYWENYLGYILDGEQNKILLSDSKAQWFEIPIENDKEEHEFLLFKRQDSCHVFTFYGLELEEGGQLLKADAMPERRIEVYGDSVSAGEVSEAIEFVGKPDPVHNGEYSNSWYSYAWMTARKLNAQIHNIAQGGIALLDATGWFYEPNYIGMEQVYDKIKYHPDLGKIENWDFLLYRPHVVIVAIGQNDSNPEDYMASDPEGEKTEKWKRHYKQFLLRLREIYPKAVIIPTTTILVHSPNWDEAIKAVCKELNDKNIHHFLYKRNGVGTPGHIRISEAEEMSEELSAFILSLGDEIWHNES